MKSNKLLFAAIGLMALTMSSCSEELETPTVNGDGNVVFTAQLPDGINSRSFNDGEKAKVLKYAVYETGTKTVIYSSDQTDAPAATYSDMKFTLSLPLVKGQTYDLVFWAESETADSATSPYTFIPSDQTIKINYDGIKCNDESRDAFFTSVTDFTVTGASQQSVKLYRPFAQLNIGTNDLTVAERAGIKHKTTKVVVKDVYTTLNLLDGKASDEAEVTFDHAERPTGESFPVATYDYLAMNYLLTGSVPVESDVNNAQKETKDITIFFNDEDDKEINKFNLSAVPFQRNYRTNIYGALLTSTVDYTIEVVPGFNDDAHTVEFDKDGFRIATSLDEAKTLLAKGEPAVSLNGELLTAETTSRAGENLVEFILNKAAAHQKLKITGEAKAGISVKYDESQATVTTPKFTLVITKSLPAVSVNLPAGEVEIVGASERADEKAQLPAVTITNAASTAITGDVTVESVTKGEDYAGEITFDGAVEITVKTVDILQEAANNGAAKILIPKDVTITLPENSNLIELNAAALTLDGTIEGPTTGGIFVVPSNHNINIDGTGTIKFNYNGDRTETEGNSHAIRAIDINGGATIKDITITSTHQKAGDAIFCNKNSDVTLENVTVNTGFRAITSLANSKIHIKGGAYHSTSNNQVMDNKNKSVYAYCIVIGGAGTAATMDKVTVTGIQGAVSVEKDAELTINDCDFSTHNLEGKDWTAFYAIYAAQSGKTIINSGKFYAPHWAVFLGNNDIQGDTFGKATIKGGIFSSVLFDQEQNKGITLLDGYKWIDNPDESTKERYPYAVVAAE